MMEGITDKKEQAKLFRKHGITARKYQGDDYYSWAVFLNGAPVYTGMSRRDVNHFKTLVLEHEVEKQK